MKRPVLYVLVSLLSACATADRRGDDGLKRLSGVELYERLCSSCHGPTGRGDGPLSALLKVEASDLTRIAHRDGGEFPTEDVRRAIDGRWDRRAHGAREMPVWGWQLYDSKSESDAQERAGVDSAIDRLVTYLRSIQQE